MSAVPPLVCDFIATTVLFAVIAYVIENDPLLLTLGETEM
jgi:hypothetical protein